MFDSQDGDQKENNMDNRKVKDLMMVLTLMASISNNYLSEDPFNDPIFRTEEDENDNRSLGQMVSRRTANP